MNSTHSRRAAVVAAAVAAGLVPWIGWLARTLPATATAAHWSTAWVGLDVAMAVGAATSAALLARQHPRADLALVATGTLMLLDTWFDTLTSTGADLPGALAEAGLVEVPLAVAAFVLAIRLTPRPRRSSAPLTPSRALTVSAGATR